MDALPQVIDLTGVERITYSFADEFFGHLFQIAADRRPPLPAPDRRQRPDPGPDRPQLPHSTDRGLTDFELVPLYWCNRFTVGDRVRLGRPEAWRVDDHASEKAKTRAEAQRYFETRVGTVTEPVIFKRYDGERPMGFYAGHRYIETSAILVHWDDIDEARYVSESELVPAS